MKGPNGQYWHPILFDGTDTWSSEYIYKLVMGSVSTNGERAGLANSKLTIDSLLETLVESPTEPYRLLSLL